MNNRTLAEERIIKLPAEARVGPPILRVKDLDRVLAFYRDVLGLQVKRPGQDQESVELGFGEQIGKFGSAASDPLLVLKYDPSAKENPRSSSGLYHFAILVPDRKSLGHAYSAIEKSRQVHFDGFGDHLVSESLYLHDPEHNGIEIYRDRPRSEWPRDKEGRIMMDTLALDLPAILDESSRDEQETSSAFPYGARIGHMHLRVTNLERSVKFYHEKLGLDIVLNLSSMAAAFLSAGGYHHHIGLNTWHTLDGKHHEPSEAGLDTFTIEVPAGNTPLRQLRSQLESALLPETRERELWVSDPDGIPIRIRFI